MIEPELIEPTPEGVVRAIRKFNAETASIENALEFVFRAHPGNTVDWQVLLKVVMLNRLYSTNIFDVHGMTSRICNAGAEIDEALAVGNPELVHTLAGFGRDRKEWSFAAKYCNWHRRDAFPIWDSRVRRYLVTLRRKTHLDFLGRNPDVWNRYEEFMKIMADLRDHYGLAAFDFKDIDKFLFIHGGKPEEFAKAAAEVGS